VGNNTVARKAAGLGAWIITNYINGNNTAIGGTAAGAGNIIAFNTGNVSRGKSVAVIGCGGVGSAAIAGSVLAGAETIIAVDVDDRKLDGATRMGATHTVNSTNDGWRSTPLALHTLELHIVIQEHERSVKLFGLWKP
jgi:Zn-dependent alcohol dehydrogenase